MKLFLIFLLLLLLTPFTNVPLHAVDVRVPRLEMFTRGFVQDEQARLSTAIDLELAFEGGYKFGVDIGFRFENQQVEDPAALEDQVLQFRYARAISRDLFSRPVNLVYFTGSIDRFASGRELQRRFGTRPFDSRFYGLRHYFPPNFRADGIRYDGISGVEGTGLQLQFPTSSTLWNLDLYLYQEERLEPGTFSGDARAMLNLPHVKLEAFAGATFPQAEAGVYRAGALMFFDTGTGGEFLAEIGLPYWAPWDSSDSLDLDSLYILLEPRLRLETFGLFLTMFWQPRYYDQQLTGTEGNTDLNAKLIFGNAHAAGLHGGIDGGMHLTPDADDEIQFSVTPFLRLTSGGVVWDFALRASIYPFDQFESFQALLGIRTGF